MLSWIAKPFIWAHHSSKVNRVFALLDTFIASINKNVAVVGLLAGVIITAINVFCRYLTGLFPDYFHLSLTWAEEIARYCFLWSALFGAAYGFRKGVHISVTMLLERFPPKLAKACMIGIHTLNSLFLAFMTYAGAMVCYGNYRIGYMSEALHNVPLWIFLLCLPLAFFGATYRSVEKIYEVSWTQADKVVKNAESEMIHDSVIKD
ncbi:TRAP transporter small permease [Helicobacter magdeburgensis]|uniref:TRAP transporter small permease n=1 Tax=Helicobacter magdeburgensis TaxID=471858 RepID=A0A4U8T046_9HELI|nr:TRAP transporter small permease [Helicobacter magdeburgensis]TLD92478.1 TRAP transporter small permease [Helicobacter magdeburgensis]